MSFYLDNHEDGEFIFAANSAQYCFVSAAVLLAKPGVTNNRKHSIGDNASLEFHVVHLNAK